jgi:hypothetical protein
MRKAYCVTSSGRYVGALPLRHLFGDHCDGLLVAVDASKPALAEMTLGPARCFKSRIRYNLAMFVHFEATGFR